VITNPAREARDTVEIARMAKRRGRGSAGERKVSVLGAVTVPGLGAVPVAEVAQAVRVAPEVDPAGEEAAASAGGARSADFASTTSGKSITRIPRGCGDTSPSEARSSHGESSARAPGTSVR
jgi:hypothetical protein